MHSFEIFRANDIRGRFKRDFDLDFVPKLARGLAQLCHKRKIPKPCFILGRDARISSPEISRLLISELLKQGVSVANVGLSPSPLCYFLMQAEERTGCIVVTASHNPPEDNGFKILFHKKHAVLDPILELKKIFQPRPKTQKGTQGETQGETQKKGPLKKTGGEGSYIDSLKEEFGEEINKFSFAVDTGNGALGPLAKKAYSALGLSPIYLFNSPDGAFPNHHPDPMLEANLLDLKRSVVEKGLDFGFAFDGDGDRLVIINQKGESLFADQFGKLFLKDLSKTPKPKEALALADVKCSDRLFAFAKDQGVKLLLSPSGHGLMRAKMEKTLAQLAIEFSGHIFFKDRKNRGFDDALYASLRFLEILSRTGLTEMAALEKGASADTGEIRIDLAQEQVEEKLSKLKAYLKGRGEKRVVEVDGFRISRKRAWMLFRSSKTQPALSFRMEAENLRELKKIKLEFSKVLGIKIP